MEKALYVYALYWFQGVILEQKVNQGFAVQNPQTLFKGPTYTLGGKGPRSGCYGSTQGSHCSPDVKHPDMAIPLKQVKNIDYFVAWQGH